MSIGKMAVIGQMFQVWQADPITICYGMQCNYCHPKLSTLICPCYLKVVGTHVCPCPSFLLKSYSCLHLPIECNFSYINTLYFHYTEFDNIYSAPLKDFCDPVITFINLIFLVISQFVITWKNWIKFLCRK